MRHIGMVRLSDEAVIFLFRLSPENVLINVERLPSGMGWGFTIVGPTFPEVQELCPVPWADLPDEAIR